MTENMVMDDRISCPFTWGLKDVLPYHRASTKRNLDDYILTGIPLTSFMIYIVSSFESIEIDKDALVALQCILEAKTALTQVSKSGKTRDISKALEHIYQTTAMHVINITCPTKKMDVSESISDIKYLNDVELAGLAGCKSFALSLYQMYFLDEAISLARIAIEGNRENALWHYLLGHGIRKKRRNSMGCSTAPSTFEIECFALAAELDPHQFYQIYYMQAMHEQALQQNTVQWQKKQFAKEQFDRYKKMWRNCDEPTILLKIALGMLRCRINCNFDVIHSVLDKVDKLSKENNTSYHYRGRLYRFQRNYEKAMEYLKLAGDKMNWPADEEYARCLIDLKKPNADIIIFLLKMKRKYKDADIDTQQATLLNLAIMYFIISDYKISAELFLKAIEISPNSAKLRMSYSFSSVFVNDTINFLKTDILPKTGPIIKVDKEFALTVEKLKIHCKLYS